MWLSSFLGCPWINCSSFWASIYLSRWFRYTYSWLKDTARFKKIETIFNTLFFSNKACLSTHCLQFHFPALPSQMTNNHHSQCRAGGRHQRWWCAVFWHHEAACNLKLYFLLNTHANLQTIQNIFKKKQNEAVMSACGMEATLAGKYNYFFMCLRGTHKNQREKITHNYLTCPLEGTFLR